MQANIVEKNPTINWQRKKNDSIKYIITLFLRYVNSEMEFAANESARRLFDISIGESARKWTDQTVNWKMLII